MNSLLVLQAGRRMYEQRIVLKNGWFMDIAIWIVVLTACLAVVGYLIKSKIDTMESKVNGLEAHRQTHSAQQAVDDDRWKRQDITNNKVDEGQREMAVVKNQIGTLHSHIDDIKASQKEMNGKLDELLQRK
ncbi:hypothetical protein [Shewanella sp.]|uniref:hypothetical protein n=1 Tax=Shewanella sp. TaxID=50422 RepID=UPI004047086B